ncbi:MAG: GAF domain-containing protein, partial [Fidelibacterota bacterium]
MMIMFLVAAALCNGYCPRHLDLLAELAGLKRGSITLLDLETGETHIEVAHGISPREKTRGKYKLGEGVTGKVIETGRPMAIPNIEREPLFLDRTGARSNVDQSKISFICVPIASEGVVIGALSVDRVFQGMGTLQEDMRLLTVISGLIAQKVVLLDQIGKETNRLREENLRLRRNLDK